MILVIAADEAEAQDLRSIVGHEIVMGRLKGITPSLAIISVARLYGRRFDEVWVRTETMQAITRDPAKWAWWCESVLTRLPAGTRPKYI